MRVWCWRHTGTDSRRNVWLDGSKHCRHDSGFALGVALILALVSLIVAFSLSEIVFQVLRRPLYQTNRCAAFGAALAGLERSDLIVSESDIFSSGDPISFSGSFSNSSFSVNITSLGGGEISIVSTGTSGGIDCVLGRTATGGGEADLRGVNYVTSYTVDGSATMDFMSGREPLQSATQFGTPDYDYYRQLAISDGHYYPGNASLSGILGNGFYFAEGNITLEMNTILASGTLATMGTITVNKNSQLTSSNWQYPSVLANSTVHIGKESTVTGAVWSGGSVTIEKDVDLTGRINADSVAIKKDITVTDDDNEDVYQELNGFTYSGGSGGQLSFSGWSESYNIEE